MEWSGRAPYTASAWTLDGVAKERRHVKQIKFDRYGGHRHRQELIPCHRPRWARGDCAASEVVAHPSGHTARQYAAVPDWNGGLRRRASLEPQTAIMRPRCPIDAGEVRAPLFEGAEE